MSWKKISTNIIYENHWVEATVDLVSTPQGSIFEYFSVKKKQHGAVCVVQNAQSQYALLSLYRYPIDEAIWQFPTEGIEAGEEDMQAALRGAKEKLRMNAQTIEKLGEYHVDPGGLIQKAKIFLLTDLEPVHHPHQEESEQADIQEIRWFSLEEIEKMVRDRQIQDAWTISSLFVLKQHLGK